MNHTPDPADQSADSTTAPTGDPAAGPGARGSSDPRRVVTVSRTVKAPASAVWDVLSDGWSYATWVVGASRVREVEDAWPAEGSHIHHSFGLWPVLINDTTEVVERSAERLVLQARGWPAGEARVVVKITPESEQSCTVELAEDAVTGPGKLVPQVARQVLIGPRNVEALRRLAYLAEGRGRSSVTAP